MWSNLPTRSTQKRRRDSKDYQVPLKLRNCQIGEDVYTTDEGFVVNDLPSNQDSEYEEESSSSSEESEEEESEEESEGTSNEEDINELVAEAKMIQERVDREALAKKDRVRREMWFRNVTRVWDEWQNTDMEFKIKNSKPKGTFWGRHEPDYAMCVRDHHDEYYIYISESGTLQCECEDFETCDIMEMVEHLRKKKSSTNNNGMPTSSEAVCSGNESTHALTL